MTHKEGLCTGTKMETASMIPHEDIAGNKDSRCLADQGMGRMLAYNRVNLSHRHPNSDSYRHGVSTTSMA